MQTKETKFMTKSDIIRLNDKAIERNFNRTIEPAFYEDILIDEANYPITMAIPHNQDAPDGGEMRVQIAYHKTPPKSFEDLLEWESETGYVFLDMTPEDYESLDAITVTNLNHVPQWSS